MTPTKAHSQFMPALCGIAKSLETYGHKPIDIIFTDNPRGDKQELEANLPSLLRNVFPVPSKSNLEHLKIPPDVTIFTLSSLYQVNTRFSSIMDSLKREDILPVALDMEWSVDRSSGTQGRVAVISIMIKNEIFLIPVCNSCLPFDCETQEDSSSTHTFMTDTSISHQHFWHSCERRRFRSLVSKSPMTSSASSGTAGSRTEKI